MLKNFFPEDKDLLPLTWWKQHPIYLSTVLAIAGAASMIVFAVLGFNLMTHLVFSVDALKELKLWTPFSYVAVNPPGIWTVIGCYLLWRFGESVERHFGRLIFVKLLLLLLVISPIMITLLHFAGFSGLAAAGIMDLEFGVFIAFATLYPQAEINLFIVSIKVWILAAIFVAVSALGDIAGRDWGSLILFAANVGAAYLFIRHQKGELRLPTIKILRDSEKKPKSNAFADVDDILDKISRDGFDSLTKEEREALDRASRKK